MGLKTLFRIVSLAALFMAGWHWGAIYHRPVIFQTPPMLTICGTNREVIEAIEEAGELREYRFIVTDQLDLHSWNGNKPWRAINCEWMTSDGTIMRGGTVEYTPPANFGMGGEWLKSGAP